MVDVLGARVHVVRAPNLSRGGENLSVTRPAAQGANGRRMLAELRIGPRVEWYERRCFRLRLHVSILERSLGSYKIPLEIADVMRL